ATTAAAPADADEYTFTAMFEPDASNDLFANSSRIDGSPQSIRAWFTSASVEAAEPLASANVTRTLWWSFVAPTNGRVQIDPILFATSQAWGAANLAVYSGLALDQLTPVRLQWPY